MSLDKLVTPSILKKTRKPALIGLYSTTPGAGKTTSAYLLSDALKSRLGQDSILRPFQAPVKLAAAAYLEAMGLNDIEATRCVFSRKDHHIAGLGDLTARGVIEGLESFARNKVRPEIWVERNEALIVRDMRKGLSVIVDDIHEKDEAEAITRLGGYMVKVSRTPMCEGATADIECATVLFNTGNLRDLEQECLGWVGRLR